MDGLNRKHPPLFVTTSDESTSSITTPTTPTHHQQGSQTMTLDELFRERGLSPPAKSKTVALDGIVSLVKEKLGWEWDDFTEEERVLLAFLVFKNQIGHLEKFHGTEGFREVLWRALKETSSYAHQSLLSFVRKGGDQPGHNLSSNDLRQAFLNKYPVWNHERDAKSIYSLFAVANESCLQPFVRFQALNTLICWCVCASNAMLYYMVITTRTKNREAILQYGINCNRYMRNNFEEEEIFRTIFQRDGGHPDKMIEKLLQSSYSCSETRKTDRLRFPVHLPATSTFDYVKEHLCTRGAIIVPNFRVFPAYKNAEETTFDGDYENMQGENDTYHAFLITGVRILPTGGIMFEVQDSLFSRPFVNVSHTLLSSMNARYIGIADDVYFEGTTPENCFDDDMCPRASPTSGSSSIPGVATNISGLTASSLNSGTYFGPKDDTDAEQTVNDGPSREKPDWIGIEVPEGMKAQDLVLWS